MKNLIIIICIFILNPIVFSQNTIENIIDDIEKNNSTLSALQKRVEVDKIHNKTGNYLKNPELEFNYLWGNPSFIGNRTDFSLKQSFDFPTSYGFKSKIANLKNEQIDIEYQRQLKSILLESRIICNDLIYYNALRKEYSKRLIHAQTVASLYLTKFNSGETSVLEYNKAQMNLFNLQKEMELVDIQLKVLIGELTSLNGGIPIEFTISEYDSPEIIDDFEQWYLQAEESNPLFSWLKKEAEILDKQVGLSKTKSFPKFQAGYMSEVNVGQKFQGISVGISIPLWEYKNEIKYSKANLIALENTISDKKNQFYNYLRNLHTKYISLQKSVEEYKAKLLSFNNYDLLKIALEKGEISLIDYILELSIYYESEISIIELEREMNKTLAELNQFI